MSVEPDIINIPSHVPSDLVWDHDISVYSKELDDPYLAAARLHDDAPDVIWATGAYFGQPGWVLTRHADIKSVYMDETHFSAFEVTDFSKMLEVDWKLNPQEIDPPAHHVYRQILQPWFQPKAVGRMDASVRALTKSLIAEIKERDSCEFVEDFARSLPSTIFLNIMGLPLEELDQFLAWEQDWVHGDTLAKQQEAMRAILTYLEDCVADRRARPRDDLLTHVAQAEIDGRPLDYGETMGMCMVLYGGGLDTVLGSLGWQMYRIATNPDLQMLLRRHPEKIGRAADELLRAHGIVQNRRTVVKDFDFKGAPFRIGDRVLLPTYLASRDPRAFEDPHRIDPDRRQDLLSFGTGVHHCLGIHLARREVRIVLEEFLAAFDDIHITPRERYSYHTTSVWGVDRLPISWAGLA